MQCLVDAEPQLESEKQNNSPQRMNLSEPRTENKARATSTAITPAARYELNSDFDISADGYTVQLGAYLSRAMAERSAGNIVIHKGQLMVQSIMLDGQYRFVIVYGQYQSREQAQACCRGL